MSEVNEPIQEQRVESIDPTAYEQVKNDMHKFKRMAQEASEREQQLNARLKEIETNQQKSQGKYKELYEATLNEKEEYKSKWENERNSILEDKKLNAVRELALKKNIRSEALDDLDMIDMQSVVVEKTDMGRYNVHGADQFVEMLQKAKPHWFQDSTPPTVNNSTGDFDGADKTYSPQDMIKLQKENPALYRDILTNKKHLIRR